VAGRFTADLSRFRDKTKAKVTAVVKQSAQEVFAIAQKPIAQGGRMPVDTGFLRNSLQSSLNGSTYLKGPDSYTLAIAGMEAGDRMFGGWTADYAIHQEYGTSRMPGRFYMRGAAQQWQAVVAKNAAEVFPR
tara:strand:- start:774 stop:1169 length:396 start_codon:yes stop_codon:yes gene_type:complete